ncbi:hypothetical protein CG719_21465 [Streptomyces sp. CB01373]|nr:winged helix-turn-helix transcriptional regulator [Streptomyces sp. CB01373]PJM94038.1 hypothetical protein CG719_21465 [Streptomyces sp. CB01373]
MARRGKSAPREAASTNPVRHGYILTERGHSLRPVMVALAAWGNRHLAPQDRAMILVDAETGQEAEPVVVDARTGKSLDDSDAYVFTAGPAAGGPMRARHTELERQRRSRSAEPEPGAA